MSEIISRELLLEIMPLSKREVWEDFHIIPKNNFESDKVGYSYKIKGIREKYIGSGAKHLNIHELAYKCKEWAYEQGYLIGLNCRQGVILIDRNTHMTLRYISIDGLDQVVKFELNLCQWLLENKDKR